MALRVLISGDREWTDGRMIEAVLYGLLDESATADDGLVVIEGCARGADRFAHDWLRIPQVPLVEHKHYPANWAKYKGKAAGPIRNRLMLSEGKPDLVVAFHDDLANSKGTKDMVTIAKAAGVPVYLVSHG